MIVQYVSAPVAVKLATDTVVGIALRGPAEANRIAARLSDDLNGRSMPERRRVAQALARIRPSGPVGLSVDAVIRSVLSV